MDSFFEVAYIFGIIVPILIVILALIFVYKGVNVVPQSEVYVIERFGKYTKTLKAGLNLIIPFLDSIAHKLSILERQLPQFKISVITKDNVEVDLESTVFYRVVDASRSVYRIKDVDGALNTAATSIVRSAAGKLELDELQSSRESMNQEIAQEMQDAAEVWGIEITRTEITDIIIDEQTKDAQRQQLNAERERRAAIAKAEGSKRSIELEAEARLFQAQKEAEAISELFGIPTYPEGHPKEGQHILSTSDYEEIYGYNPWEGKSEKEQMNELMPEKKGLDVTVPLEYGG